MTFGWRQLPHEEFPALGAIDVEPFMPRRLPSVVSPTLAALSPIVARVCCQDGTPIMSLYAEGPFQCGGHRPRRSQSGREYRGASERVGQKDARLCMIDIEGGAVSGLRN